MESSSKRRKISPTTEGTIHVLNTQPASASQNAVQTSSRRASFLSPTKASLARFNPNLLPRATSTEPRRPRSSGGRGIERETRAKSNTPDEVNGTAHNWNALAHLKRPNGSSLAADALSGGTGLRASPRRQRTPRIYDTPSKVPRPAVATNLRASPPQAASEAPGVAHPDGLGAANGGTMINGDGAAIDPRLLSTPTRTGIVGAPIEQDEDGEPRLPSTPSQLGLEPPPEKPKGLLFSSPSRRPRRKDKPSTKSSPLKPVDSGPGPAVPSQDRAVSKLGPKIYIESELGPVPSSERTKLLSKEKDLKRLNSQLQNLQDQLAKDLLLSRFVNDDSFRKKRIPLRRKEISEKATKILAIREDIKHQALLWAIPEPEVSPAMARKTPSNHLALFLPFSSHPPPKPPLPSAASDSADDPPLLAINVKTSSLDQADPTRLEIHQTVSLTPAHMPQMAVMLFTIDAITQSITNSSIETLAPWAAELRPWIASPSIPRALPALGKSFYRYASIARLRAECWAELATSFPDLLRPRKDTPEYFGTKYLTFARSSTSLTIRWDISAADNEDDGKVVQSQISAETSFPDNWKDIDEAEDLARVGDAFKALVKRVGVVEAARVVVSLLFPER